MRHALMLSVVLLTASCDDGVPLALRTPQLLQAQGGTVTATATFTPDAGNAEPEVVVLEQTTDGWCAEVIVDI